MNPDPYSQNSNPYTGGGYEKTKIGKLLLAVAGLVVIVLLLLVFRPHHSPSGSQQDPYIKSATAAARKEVPDAKVSHLKVSGGFALAVVSDPSAGGQAGAGNTTVFKVNPDGSMTQLATGSSFGPLDLLELGVPFATQANLLGSSADQVKQNFADQCGYEGGSEPGYSGFGGSFGSDEWQIDSATLSGLEQAVSDAIKGQDAAVICVNATQKNSNATTDTNTYISTFTLQAQFITADGTLTVHTLTFATGPNYYRSYTLDGQHIQ